jgi:hypothetical protein
MDRPALRRMHPSGAGFLPCDISSGHTADAVFCSSSDISALSRI